MISRLFLALTLALTLTAALATCTSATQRSPDLSAGPSTSAPPETHRNVFQQAGDTTWRIVTAPAALVPSAKKAPPKAPETYEAPTAVIMQRDYSNESDTPTTQPAHP